jgi:hypothetical protein
MTNRSYSMDGKSVFSVLFVLIFLSLWFFFYNGIFFSPKQAPESLQNRTYSTKTDVWSFGCIGSIVVSNVFVILIHHNSL